MAGFYAASGAINVSEGTSGIGLYAPDGSIRITNAPAEGFCGLHAPDGSIYVDTGHVGLYAPNGAWNVSETYNGSSVFVNVVTGSIT